ADGPAELVIETQVTEITGDQLRYCGYDAIELAREREFEEVAGLLWTGALADADAAATAGAAGTAGDQGAAVPWLATDAAVAAASAAQAALPSGTLPLERLQVIVPALAAADPLRLHLDPPAVIAAGRGLIAGMADSLPPGRPAPGRAARQARGSSIAERLATRLCPVAPGPGLLRALRAAMVLLADHELAASTLAARVAASMRADPYAVVATGLGAVGGALHGGASFGAELMLRSAAGPQEAARVVGDLLRRGERIPGFGHFVYRGSDPRAVLLISMLREAAPGSERLAVADAVIAEARRRALPEPNIDFALAVLATIAGMVPGGGEAVFAVARTAGWLAHALEEYARGTPIRPRGIYTGPAWAPR
ncbi:MAG TPA: citrate/2-methylcitrate synthase, partial [Streptosporangiaceae bacterium]|nr:citrate/2-methylcitrate synthase [Streptosporangiaceae bacterium]